MGKRKPLAVLISDIHYNLNTLQIADTALTLALNKATELGVPLIVAGDLHDTKAMLRGECISKLMHTLQCAPIRRIVMIGNHDLLNENGKEHSLEFLRPVCELVDTPTFDKETGLYFIPYQTSAEDMENEVSKTPVGSIVITHQGVLAAASHYINDRSAVSPGIFDGRVVFSGHYHAHQTISCGKSGSFTYIGNPYTLTFGEARDPTKGFLLIFDDGTFQHIPTNLRKHLVLDVSHDEAVDTSDVREGDIIWVKIRGPKNELQKVNKKALALKLGTENFKLDLIPLDDLPLEEDTEALQPLEVFDLLIEASNIGPSQKARLKQLTRDLMNETW